ncbi:hypothetical protein IW150_004715, partial [Coemansia sp. RSA 2607]
QQQQHVHSRTSSLAPSASPTPVPASKPDRPVSYDDICIICCAADHQMLECPHRMNTEMLNRRMREVQADGNISESKRFILRSALANFLSASTAVNGPH